MKITVVYGGRGLIEDPALYVLEKMQMVMEELRVNVERINLYEEKNQITTLPSVLKDTDGVVLVVSLEWFGIGGYMQQFLDACWLYGDKEKIQNLYMMPVVLATTSGEKDAMVFLEKAWEVLGGIPANGMCAYVENPVDFELNKEYGEIIENKTEQLYRIINQKRPMLPSSSTVIRNKVLKPKSIDLTPQESEQLSKFVSDDTYVKQQKEDIEELAAMFKGMLNEEEVPDTVGDNKENIQDNFQKNMLEKDEKPLMAGQDIAEERVVSKPVSIEEPVQQKPQIIPKDFRDRFRQNFYPEPGFSAVYIVTITDKDEMLKIQVNVEQLEISYTNEEVGDVIMRVSSGVLNRITSGDMTFQRAFMGGDMKVKGNFKTLRTLDQIFRFV